MRSIVFTLCSNNYLAHAKTLGDSILDLNPGIRFIVGLVDERDPRIDYGEFDAFEIVGFNEIGFPFLHEMLSKYNIIEFNTSVKPYYIDHLFNRFPDVDNVYYIDPDILFYEDLGELDDLLDEHDIVLTPHLTVAPDTVTTDELVAMRHGHFNLGFIGLRRSEESAKFVDWWQTRLREHCVIDKCQGLFVDQKWVDLAPLYFDGIYNFKHQGYNMAWWNMGERKIIRRNGKYFVNDEHQPLVFFHFSGFKPDGGEHFGRVSLSEYSFETRPDLLDLFDDYAGRLMRNDYRKFWALTPLLEFGDSSAVTRRSLRSLVKSGLKRLPGR